jgi:hypothetical protein
MKQKSINTTSYAVGKCDVDGKGSADSAVVPYRKHGRGPQVDSYSDVHGKNESVGTGPMENFHGTSHVPQNTFAKRNRNRASTKSPSRPWKDT